MKRYANSFSFMYSVYSSPPSAGYQRYSIIFLFIICHFSNFSSLLSSIRCFCCRTRITKQLSRPFSHIQIIKIARAGNSLYLQTLLKYLENFHAIFRLPSISIICNHSYFVFAKCKFLPSPFVRRDFINIL